jgi:hypothetical protein
MTHLTLWPSGWLQPDLLVIASIRLPERLGPRWTGPGGWDPASRAQTRVRTSDASGRAATMVAQTGPRDYKIWINGGHLHDDEWLPLIESGRYGQ